MTSRDSNITGATMTINNDQSGDALHFTPQNGISVASNSGGVLTLTGIATPAQYQAALQSVTFSSISTSTAARSISVVSIDNSVDSNTAAETINISAPVTITGVYISGSAWTQHLQDVSVGPQPGQLDHGLRHEDGGHGHHRPARPSALGEPQYDRHPVLRSSHRHHHRLAEAGGWNRTREPLRPPRSRPSAPWEATPIRSACRARWATTSMSLAVASTGSSFGPAVTDANGAGISGTFTTSSSSFPSGNGLAGSTFDYFFNVLPGNENQNGLVNAANTAAAKAELNFRTTTTGYNYLVDYNGAGVINANDVNIDNSHLNNRQSTITSPAAPSGAPVGGLSAGFTALALGVQESGSTSLTTGGSTSSGSSTPAVANVIPAVDFDDRAVRRAAVRRVARPAADRAVLHLEIQVPRPRAAAVTAAMYSTAANSPLRPTGFRQSGRKKPTFPGASIATWSNPGSRTLSWTCWRRWTRWRRSPAGLESVSLLFCLPPESDRLLARERANHRDAVLAESSSWPNPDQD